MAQNPSTRSPFDDFVIESSPMPDMPAPTARTETEEPAAPKQSAPRSRGNGPSVDDLRARAEELGVDPNLATAIFSQESSGNWNSRNSPKGAIGGMQVMGPTYKMMMGTAEGQGDPWNNMEAGLRYLRYGQTRLGTKDPAILAAGYHAGMDRKDLRNGVIPAEIGDGLIKTVDYSKNIVARMNDTRGKLLPGAAKASQVDQPGAAGQPPSDDDFIITPASKPEDDFEIVSDPDALARFNDPVQFKTDATPNDGNILTDIGRNLKIGANTAAQDVKELVGRIPGVGPSIVKAGDAVDQYFTGKTSDQILNQDNEAMRKGLTPAMQGALEKKWWDSEKGTFGGAWSDPRAYLGGVVQSLPEQLLTTIPAMRLAKYAFGAKIAAGATAEAAAATAARTATVAGGIGEGLLGGAQSAREVREEVMKIKPEVLATSEAYNALLKSGMQPAEAQKALAEDLSTRAFITSGVTTGMFGGLGDRALAKIFTEAAGKATVKKVIGNAVKGGVAEGVLEELPQSAAQKLTQNEAIKQANPKQELTEGVANEALGGMVLGGLQGAGMGAGSTRSSQPAAAAPAPLVPADNAPSTSGGPLNRALDNAAVQPQRVQATAPDGSQVSGTVTATSADGTVEIVGDDGVIHTIQTGAAGIKITPQEPVAPLTNALDAAAGRELENPAPEPVVQDQDSSTIGGQETVGQTDDVSPPADPIATEVSQQNEVPTQDGQASEAIETVADEPAPAAEPAPARTEPKSIDQMDEPELRARLKYIATQAKTNGGWDKLTSTMRREVEQEISKRQKEAEIAAALEQPPATPATGEPAPQNVSRETEIKVDEPKKLKATSDVSPIQQKGLDRIAKGTAYFHDKGRAADWLAKHDLGATHEVVPNKKRFDIKAKTEPAKGTPGHPTHSQDRVVSDEDIEFNRKLAAGQEAERLKDDGYKVPEDVGAALRKLGASPDSKTKETGWSLPTNVGGLGDVFVKFDPVTHQATITAQHMGKTYDERKATGAAAIAEAVERARDGIDAGVTEMARRTAATRVTTETPRLSNQENDDGKQPAPSTEKVEQAAYAVRTEGAAVQPDAEKGGGTVPAEEGRQEEVKAKRGKKPVTRRITNQDGSYYTVEVSDQFLSYEKWISDGKPVPQGMREQITADDRLNDGEAERLLAMADKAAANEPTEPTPPAGGKPDPFAKNKVFTSEAVAKARARMKSKLGQFNNGLDPELVVDGMTVAGAYIEAGTRSFAAYSKAMIDDFGDAIKPYLLSFYEAVRHYPSIDRDGMSTPASAQAQHEALMLAASEDVQKPAQAAKVEKPENVNEPTKLDRPGPDKLEGEQPQPVQGSQQPRETGAGAAPSGRADASGDDGARGAGVQQPGSVGAGAGEVSVPASGAAKGRGSERGSPPVQRGKRPAKPNPERDVGGIPDLFPTDGQRAQDRADDFVISDEDAIGEGGQKAKFRQNIAAIKLLKELELRRAQATRDEQAVLAKYVGWGGIPQAFERDGGEVSKGWEKEAAELKGLLTKEELDAAAASTRNAHYTSPEIVGALWDAVRRMGFSGGRTLEPSVGVGNFFGLMPTDLRAASQLTGVELDRLTGGIAKQLYPQANIQAPVGFQAFNTPDGYFDLAIGNPPFGQEKLYDPSNKALSGLSIHNYFFAKSINALRPNGVLAMVVTNRLLDSAGDKARSYISDRADFIGAIRLPNNAFLKNAGTEVTTDIIFLRKRADGEAPSNTAWANVRQIKDAKGIEVPLNEYFVANPDMMLGDFGAYGSMYSPTDPALVAKDGQDTPALLKAAIERLPKGIMSPAAAEVKLETSEPAGDVSAVKVGSVFIENGKVYERREDMLGKQQAAPVTFPSDKARDRVMGMIDVRDALVAVRRLQLQEGVKDSQLDIARGVLNKSYDAFVKANGPINVDANKRLMRDDPSWPQLAALEDNFDKGVSRAVAKTTGETPREPSATKSAIFTKRTQAPYKPPSQAATAKDAMVASLAERGRVDLDYMATLYPGRTADQIMRELGPLVFRNPTGGVETRDQYLSGNVKKKLAQAIDAAKADRGLQGNVDALREVQPKDIEAVDIDVKTGAHWVPADVMETFLKDISEAQKAKAFYNRTTANWTIEIERYSAAASTAYATDRVSLKNILEAAANQKTVQVYDQNGDGTRTLNEKATAAANEKVEKVKAEWRGWLWKDDARRERLARIYNDVFNTDVAREFDGSHLTLPGKVSDDIVTLRPHQKNAVWRIIQSDTTLLDHVVGSGKTYTVIAAVMEKRRMGLAKKPMLAVPNHLVGQWAVDFVKLYPGANILAATKKDFEKDNRKKLFARIASGDWDAVIVAHSSLGKVEVEPEFQAKFINFQIEDMDRSIQEMRRAEGKGSRNVKQIEKQKALLEEKLKRLFASGAKDDNLHWNELGVDDLSVDEAHEFKNLGFSTSMTRVAGLGNPTGSQKAADLYMKSQALLERTGGRNLTFATGTPISNTMAEMYTMQRYLDSPTLQDQGISHFDAWAKTFGEVVTDWELSPSGQYKMNSRFAKFVNMPELMQRYTSFADVVNRDDINRMLAAQGKKLPVPKVAGGKPNNVVVARSSDQADYIGVATVDEHGVESYAKGTLIWRAENLPKKAEKGADNMLKIMSDARKAALDMRLIDPNYGDNPGSKVNDAANRIRAIYDKWASDKGAQLVFIDLSTPKGAVAKEAAALRETMAAAEQGDEAAQEKLDAMSPDELMALESASFSVYDDLKAKLIARGIPENEIAFIHDANTELQKEDLFGKVRSGRIRVLFGSTAKMGAGMNVQERLVALHHLDAPWRPSDLEQREGRIIRQGNSLYDADPENFEVEILRYATKQTLDSRMWQTIEAKARFIEQVRKGTGERQVEDVAGEASNSAEMKAASSGNPLILEEMSLRQAIRKLENQRSEHDRDQHRVRDNIRWAKVTSERNLKDVGLYETDAPLAPKEFAITIGGQTFDKHKEAGEALMAAVDAMHTAGEDSRELGSYGGFKVTADDTSRDMLQKNAVLTLQGKANSYQVEVNTGSGSATGLALRVQNTVKHLADDAAKARADAKNQQAQIPKLEAQIAPWGKDAELTEAKARHMDVIEQLKPKKAPAKQAAEPGEKLSVDQGDAQTDNSDYGPATQAHRDAVAKLQDAFNRQLAGAGRPPIVLDAVAPGSGQRGKGLSSIAFLSKRLFGREVVFVKFEKGQSLFNGLVRKAEPGRVFLNPDSKTPLMAVLGHELLHEMRKSAPGIYAKLSSRLGTVMRGEVFYTKRMTDMYTSKGLNPEGVDFREELEADIVGDNFMDKEFWAKLADGQPSLMRQIVSFVTKWLDGLARKIEAMAQRPFRTNIFLNDIAAAREAVADAMREFSGTQVGAVAGADAMSVAADQTDTAEFKKWFGDSKVVDANGKPLVVYHGTSGNDFSQFETYGLSSHFGTKGAAEDILQLHSGVTKSTDPRTSNYWSGARVVPAYLSVSNPVRIPDLENWNTQDVLRELTKPGVLAQSEVNAIERQWREDMGENDADGRELIRLALLEKGYDGIVYTNKHEDKGRDSYIAFRPEQIKSAIGNNGAFDGTDPDIRMRVADEVQAKEPEGLTPPEQGILRKVQAAVQDSLNRVKQVQERIEKATGGKVPEFADYYQAETNRPGRIAARLEDARDGLLQPLMAKLAKSGHTSEELGELLHAQHAVERNERVASINPDMPDGGSGMTNAEAAAVLEKYRDNKELHALADQARKISKETLELKLAYGLIDSDTYSTLADVYENYVPLKGDGEYGPKIKRAMGHDEREEHILENIARDHEQAVVAGERNLARQSLLQMALRNPDRALWTVGIPPKGRYITGQSYRVYKGNEVVGEFPSAAQAQAWVDGRTDSGFDYVIQTERGKFTVEKNGVPAAYFTSHSKAEDYIAGIKDPVGKFEIKTTGEKVREFVKPLQNNEVLVFVDGQPVRIQINDETLAAQLRPLDQGKMNVVLEFMRGFNRYLSKIYTGYNPAFIAINLLRDVQTGTVNILGNEGAGTAARAWLNYPAALAAMTKFAATKKTPGGETGKYLAEYRMHGGKTGASWMSDLEEQGKTLQRMYDDAYGASGYLAKGQAGKAAMIAGRKTVGGMAHVVEVLNQATENSLRLALFMTLRKQGVSAGQAAQAAKNVTVNFDRKGTLTPALGAIYLFFNPAVQGTANAMKTLFKGENKAQAWAALGALAALGFWAAGQGMDDDKDRWLGKDWSTRARKLVVNVGGHTITIPLSLEFAPFYAAGVAMGEASRGESKLASAGRVLASFLDAYFPLQGFYNPDSNNHAADAAISATPTILKQGVQTAMNRNSFGSQIVPESEFTKDRPDNAKMFRGTRGTAYDDAAQGIAKAGEALGASRYENDITKVSPETLKALWKTYTGGLGTFVGDVAGAAKIAAQDPGSMQAGDMPIVKSLVTDTDVKPIRSRFYDLKRETDAAAAEFKAAKKAGDGEALDAFLSQPTKTQMMALDKLMDKTAKSAAKLRDLEVDINSDVSMSLSQKRAALKEIEREEEALYRSALDAFRP